MKSRRIPREQLPPGPRLPSVIQLLAFWTRPAASMRRLRERYGKRISVRLPFQPPFVILSDPEEVKQLFTAPPDVLHPGEGAKILEATLGRNSVILLDEDPHLKQRRLMLPAFHGEKMQRMLGLMTELAEREIESWPSDEPLRLHPRLQRLTLEIILRAVFGLEQGQRLDDLRDLLTEVLAFSESPLSVLPAVQRRAPWLPALRRFNALLKRTDQLIFELIDERRVTAAHDGAARDDVLAMLLEARHEEGSPMSAQELRDELMTALVAGHETTASELAWGFEALANEPRVVKRLQAELDAGDEDEYLTATVNEILRLRPVLPNAEPRLTVKPVKIGGWEYPPGIALLASIWGIHHDPELYPDPYAFRPERFLETPPGTYTWIPFGGGRRRCLGASFALQEMRIVLAVLLSRCDITAASSRREETNRRSITFSPSGGATVILHDRVRKSMPAARPVAA